MQEVEADDLTVDLTDDSKRDQLLKFKLTKELHELAVKIKADPDAQLSTGKIKVSNGRVEIKVYLHKQSDATLSKLKALGFVKLARAKSVNLLVGTIEASNLEELALIKTVRWIEPA